MPLPAARREWSGLVELQDTASAPSFQVNARVAATVKPLDIPREAGPEILPGRGVVVHEQPDVNLTKWNDVKTYLLSVPERVVQSVLGLGAGVAREVTEVALPAGIRSSQLYRNLVDATLRFLIEQVGGVERVYRPEDALPDNFLVRRTAGNAVEVLGIVAFRASPVWILAALADLCGMGRHLIPEIADALKAQGLLEKTSVHQRR